MSSLDYPIQKARKNRTIDTEQPQKFIDSPQLSCMISNAPDDCANIADNLVSVQSLNR